MRPFVLTLLLLAACAPAPQPAPGPESPAETPSFLGAWARRADQCRDFAWTFEPARLDAPGELFCTYPNAARTPSGYRLTGTCSGEAAVEPDEIVLEMLGPDRMRASAKAWGEAVELIRCP